jgi:flagellar hook-length control protein FliK
MQQETQLPPSLSFALPFLDQQEVKPLHIELEQRDQQQEDKEKSWDIRLSFELADLGPVACHIFLQGMAVAASFYCEKSQTRTRVEQALPELKQQLSVAGFSAGELHSFPGKPGQPQTSTTTSYAESLIDIEV